MLSPAGTTAGDGKRPLTTFRDDRAGLRLAGRGTTRGTSLGHTPVHCVLSGRPRAASAQAERLERPGSPLLIRRFWVRAPGAPPTDRPIVRTESPVRAVWPASLGSLSGMGVQGPGLRNTGMTPSSVSRISATKASMAALRSAWAPPVMTSAR